MERKIPRLAKLSECKYCLGFWISGATALVLSTLGLCVVLKVAILWLGLHRVATFLDEFMERYLNRAPLSVFLARREMEDEDED